MPEVVYLVLLGIAAVAVICFTASMYMDRREIGDLKAELQTMADIAETEVRITCDRREIVRHTFSNLYMLAKSNGGMLEGDDHWMVMDTAYGTMRFGIRTVKPKGAKHAAFFG